jgi:hypothetical protein
MPKPREVTIQKETMNAAVELHLQSIGRQLWLMMQNFPYDTAYIFAQPESGTKHINVFRKEGDTLTSHKPDFLLADAFIDLWEDWPEEKDGLMWYACELSLARDGSYRMQLFYPSPEAMETSPADTCKEWLEENFGDSVKVVYPQG